MNKDHVFHRHQGHDFREGEPCPYCRLEQIEARLKEKEREARELIGEGKSWWKKFVKLFSLR